jgi:hypothetical protein
MLTLVLRIVCGVFSLVALAFSGQFAAFGKWWHTAVGRSVLAFKAGLLGVTGIAALSLRSVAFTSRADGWTLAGCLTYLTGVLAWRMVLLRRLHGTWLPKLTAPRPTPRTPALRNTPFRPESHPRQDQARTGAR